MLLRSCALRHERRLWRWCHLALFFIRFTSLTLPSRMSLQLMCDRKNFFTCSLHGLHISAIGWPRVTLSYSGGSAACGLSVLWCSWAEERSECRSSLLWLFLWGVSSGRLTLGEVSKVWYALCVLIAVLLLLLLMLLLMLTKFDWETRRAASGVRGRSAMGDCNFSSWAKLDTLHKLVVLLLLLLVILLLVGVVLAMTFWWPSVVGKDAEVGIIVQGDGDETGSITGLRSYAKRGLLYRSDGVACSDNDCAGSRAAL